MKKLGLFILSIVMVATCFGALAGCKPAKTPVVTPPTEAEKIAELKEIANNFSLGSLSGGAKLSWDMDGDKEIMVGKKEGERYVVKHTSIKTLPANNKDSYIVDGYQLQNVDGAYSVASYMPLDMSLVYQISWRALVFPALESKLTTENGITQLVEMNEFDDSLLKATYKFNSDKKLTEFAVEDYNKYSLDSKMSVEYGVQEFVVPAAALAVDLTTDDLKAQKLVNDIDATNSKEDFIDRVGGITATRKEVQGTDTKTATSYITKNAILIIDDTETDYYIGDDWYNLSAGVIDWEYEKNTGSSRAMYAVVGITNSAYYQRFRSEVSVATVGNTTTVTAKNGEEYFVITDNKITKIVWNNSNGSDVTKVEETYVYGAVTLTVPDAIKNYVKTDEDKKSESIQKRLEGISRYNLYKQQGVKIVGGEGDGVQTSIVSFANMMDEGTMTLGTSLMYVYRSSLYTLTDGTVKKGSDKHSFYYLHFGQAEELVNKITNTVTLTNDTIVIKNGETTVVTLYIKEGGLLTKLELSGTIFTYTYGAQTVSVPKAVIDFANAPSLPTPPSNS